jgi:serine protease Do
MRQGAASILYTVTITAMLLLLAGAPLSAGAMEDDRFCPACEAPVESGASFCTRCGHKLAAGEPAAAPEAHAPDPRASVVQVVAAHDKEMTTAFGAITYGTNLRIDSMLGSGFAIGAGEFVTDSGLLAGVREVLLYDAMQRKLPARVLGVDHQIGVALLVADTTDIPPLALRDGEPPRLGETIRAFGFPSGSGTASGLLATSGVLSGMHRTDFGIHPIEDYQQSDATLPSGFAGGPVVDAEGRLVGMSTALPLGRRLVLGPAGIGLSIPLAWIDRSLKWIRAGQPARPWLGVVAVRADPERQAFHNLPTAVDAVIEEVFPDSPSARSGMRRGDGLLRVDGIDGSDLTAIHNGLLKAHAGDLWQVEIVRAGQPHTFDVTLAVRPDDPRLSALDALRFYGGLEVAPRGRKLVVTNVLPRTLAAGSAIETGDVLQSVLIKKDLKQADRGSARWRSVRNVEKLEKFLQYAYSDIDFFVGLHFKRQRGQNRDLYLYELLISTNAM